jgi:outer membrane cobalamin receptor
MFVGRRDDTDAVTFTRVSVPSYFRVDAALTTARLWKGLAAWGRVTNLFGRDYSEVAGYPSPGRRWVVGIDLTF